MILKCKINNKDNNSDCEGWAYYDGIKSTRVFTEKHDGVNCVMVDLNDSPHNGIVAIYSEAYLLNDNGKTLQVVHS